MLVFSMGPTLWEHGNYMKEAGLLSISNGQKAGWQIWLLVWFQDAQSFLGTTSVIGSYGCRLAFVWSCTQISRAQYSVGIPHTCGCRIGLHLHVSGQIPWCCLPSRPGVTVPHDADRDCCRLCGTRLDPSVPLKCHVVICNHEHFNN